VADADAQGPETARLIRAWIGAMRGDLSEVLEDAHIALEAARRLGAAQGMYPALAVTAFVHSEAGEPEAAIVLLRELSDSWSEFELAYGAPADMVIPWLEYLGAHHWHEKYDTKGAVQTAWLEAGRRSPTRITHAPLSSMSEAAPSPMLPPRSCTRRASSSKQAAASKRSGTFSRRCPSTARWVRPAAYNRAKRFSRQRHS
jgi:hypothetical protein